MLAFMKFVRIVGTIQSIAKVLCLVELLRHANLGRVHFEALINLHLVAIWIPTEAIVRASTKKRRNIVQRQEFILVSIG